MPAIDKTFIDSIDPSLPEHYPTFVETGTYYGATVFAMEPFFAELHTIEIDPKLHGLTRSRYQGGKVTFHLGDSAEVLKSLVSQITTAAVFFLDGHWSGGVTGRGPKDCPLLEEMEAIVAGLQERCVIIIDDCRLFGTHRSEDWTRIDERAVLGICGARLKKWCYKPSELDPEDRMVLRF